MSGCFPDAGTSEWTICGKCLLRVPINGIHGDHLCDIVQQLKKSFNFALSEIQNEFHKCDKINKERLDEIDEFNKLQTRYNNLSKPFKCPVCDGSGKIQIPTPFHSNANQVSSDALGRYFIQCKTCEGKRIVWG